MNNNSNNGGFVMPKIYSLNVEQDSKEQFNFYPWGGKYKVPCILIIIMLDFHTFYIFIPSSYQYIHIICYYSLGFQIYK